MNTTTLIEMREYHTGKAEELRMVSRMVLREDEGLDEEQRQDLLMHERFVSALDEVLANPSKP